MVDKNKVGKDVVQIKIYKREKQDQKKHCKIGLGIFFVPKVWPLCNLAKDPNFYKLVLWDIGMIGPDFEVDFE